jgi:hypothetical protein
MGGEFDQDDEELEIYAAVVGSYEAESFTFQSGCAKATNHAGYTGTGFVDYGGNGTLIEWNNVSVPTAGQYTLVFRYANGSTGNRQCAVTVNDKTNAGNVTFAKTGAWTTWATQSIKVSLQQGNNTIRVTANTSAGGPNLDKMDVTSEDGGTGTGGQCAVVSEGSTASLSCPSGQVIGSIVFASYGTPSGSCPSFSTSGCHSLTSKSKAESLCLNKQSCGVSATNAVFGDPCSGTPKKLAVAFTCKSVAPTGQCAQVGEGSTASLSCPSGQLIRSISFASYGTPAGNCPSFQRGSCHASNSQSRVESACLNKQTCSVGANNSVFGDPCSGTPKKLAITYTCGTASTNDQCPNDSNKTSPGICGCGVPDTDSDKDGTPDCKDGCKDDPLKTAPGQCGCGKPEGTCSPDDGKTGLYNSMLSTLPGNQPTACEWDWTIRTLHYQPTGIVPRRMYFSSCKTQSSNPEMFVSLSVGADAGQGQRDATSGVLVRTRLNSSTGALETITSRRFPECLEMHGIATSSDCNTVAALCRIPSGTPGADKDSLATHSNADWMTQPYSCGNKKNDEMWLYEWKNGDIQTQPRRYIVHKAIGSWEYGNNYLRYGESDNTYAIAVKATVGNGSCHEADAFLILNRADYSMTSRGWSWACGTGHTTFNRPAYDPTTKKYAMMCSTDYNDDQIGGLGAVYFRMENGSAQEFHRVNLDGLKNKGGASTLVARPGGGFIGLMVGVDGIIKAEGYPRTPPTSIGLVQFGADGTRQGGINWVVKNDSAYVSYPQLVSLGNDRYLLGWGVMKKLNDPTDTKDDSYRIPWEYYVMEIDSNGNRLSSPTLLQGTGWGELDEMVPLGQGRVAWAYIKNPALSSGGAYPSCNSSSLQLSVYVSGVR